MAWASFHCTHCGLYGLKQRGEINRAAKAGLSLYCDRTCSGRGRRKHISDAEKVSRKAEYDRQRRIDLADRLRVEKAAYFQRTYDPVKAAVERKAKMPRHVEYCRQPRYRKWKADYDKKYLARKQYGPFGEAAILLNQLETEVLSRASRLEISTTNGTLNKKQSRRREYDRQTQCS